MKTMMLAAVSALSLGMGVAFANEGGPAANTEFTEIPGVVAQAPVQNLPPVATAQNGQVTHSFAARSSQGTWIFAPTQYGNG
ncbi:MAG: hypothetical protein WDN25_06410 [Acetobacteraceae bacterium]